MKDNVTITADVNSMPISEYYMHECFNPQSKEDIFKEASDRISSSFELKANDTTMLNCTDILLSDEDIQFINMLADTVSHTIYLDKEPQFSKPKDKFIESETWVLVIDNITNYIRIKTEQITFIPDISMIRKYPGSEPVVSKQVSHKKLKNYILDSFNRIKISFALNLSIIIFTDSETLTGTTRNMHVITTNQIGTRDKTGLPVIGYDNSYNIMNLLKSSYSVVKCASKLNDTIKLSFADDCKIISDTVTKVVMDVLQSTNSYHLGRMVLLKKCIDKDGKTDDSVEYYPSKITWDNTSEVVPEFINRHFADVISVSTDITSYPRTMKHLILIEIAADSVISISFPLTRWYEAGYFDIQCFNVKLETAIDNFCKPLKLVHGCNE